MQKQLIVSILAFASLAFATADNKIPPPKPEDGQRETKWKVEDPGIINLQHREKLYESGPHRFDATAAYKKNFVDKMDPARTIARVDYKYLPGDTSLGVQAENIQRFGTVLSAEATRNLYKDRKSSLDVGVNYGQTFSPFVRSEPFFGGFVRGRF
ncbi:uncharacterized protein [Tenebrio molitor]|jgi:hypothetical protein|uniref:Attacin 1a n=1 Tax=Tenebrio molitor TaxID=7067 RepID=A0A345F0W3_TENMO|nr:attacin 1a [Tenebrio molitor]